jgi:hypothetical protein
MTVGFTHDLTLSPDNLISGKYAVKKKRQRFPGAPLVSPGSLTLPFIIHDDAQEY